MMTDPDSMLSLTGVIATILSVFFAIAAFIVRLRGKKHSAAGKVREENMRTVLEAHEVPRLPPPEKILARQEAEHEHPLELVVPESAPAPEAVPAARTPLKGSDEELSAEEAFKMPTTVFKKYSATRETGELVPPSEEKEVYAWD